MSCARSDELKSGANAERGVTERQGGGRGSGCLTLIVTSWSTKYCPAVTFNIISDNIVHPNMLGASLPSQWSEGSFVNIYHPDT